MLFEKQRLRLRRVLQTAQQQGATKPDKSAGNTPASTPARASKGRDRTEARSAGTPVGASPSYQETQVKKTPVSGAKTKMGTTPVPSSKKKTKKPISPLYAWERPTEDSENSNLARRPVITEHGQFIPSDRIRGFYEQQHQEVSNKYVDFQIILSELEYQELLAKRRAQKARGKVRDPFFCTAQQRYVFSNTRASCSLVSVGNGQAEAGPKLAVPLLIDAVRRRESRREQPLSLEEVVWRLFVVDAFAPHRGSVITFVG